MIPGYFHDGTVTDAVETPPHYCQNCGAPYPWMESFIEEMTEWIQRANELTPAEKSDFQEAIPEVTRDTPGAARAAAKIKIYLGKISRTAADGIKQILIQITAEAVKKTIGL